MKGDEGWKSTLQSLKPPINTGDSKGMMKGEGFCAYPISKNALMSF